MPSDVISTATVLLIRQNPHPAMAEVKYVHQNFAFEAVDLGAGKFRVINRQYFPIPMGTHSDTRLLKTVKVTDGTIPVALQPQQSKEFAIPVGNVKVNDGASLLEF